MLTAGIDSGSRAVKCILWDGTRVVGRALVDSGLDVAAGARQALDAACAGGSRPDAICATGYGRAAVPGADHRVTEITCHARGLAQVLPQARSAIEIGGQDSKVLRLDQRGQVADFAMNDRCAAGTGRFLEVIAGRLGHDPAGFGRLAAGGAATPISAMCVVFAESEIVGLVAGGTPPADIAAGVIASIASRVAALAGRLLADPVALTGGVGLLPGMAEALSRATGRNVLTAPDPQFTGALGAALIAAERSRPR